ncbi:hypothetical protein CRG98_042397 [Punica granatum]|uniref:Uncharacterized protein n=1 Tax=Punica granatum TaxID=22663 RepID=A0A2I0I153_PUNGR|nr:hypothetical protein CRG98_042397 [Punica granatum]
MRQHPTQASRVLGWQSLGGNHEVTFMTNEIANFGDSQEVRTIAIAELLSFYPPTSFQASGQGSSPHRRLGFWALACVPLGFLSLGIPTTRIFRETEVGISLAILADSMKALGNKVDALSVQKANGTSSSSSDPVQSDRPWQPQDREAIQHLTVAPLRLSLPGHPAVAKISTSPFQHTGIWSPNQEVVFSAPQGTQYLGPQYSLAAVVWTTAFPAGAAPAPVAIAVPKSCGFPTSTGCAQGLAQQVLPVVLSNVQGQQEVRASQIDRNELQDLIQEIYGLAINQVGRPLYRLPYPEWIDHHHTLYRLQASLLSFLVTA